MTIYYELFEKKIRELPETLTDLSLEDAIEELKEAEKETDKLFYGQNTLEAVQRAKAQLWAYKQIIANYKDLLAQCKEEGIPVTDTDVQNEIMTIEKEIKELNPDKDDFSNKIEEIIGELQDCAGADIKSKETYKKIAELSLETLEKTRKEFENLEQKHYELSEKHETLQENIRELEEENKNIESETKYSEKQIIDELNCNPDNTS